MEFIRSPQKYQRQIDPYELEPLSREDYIKMRVDGAIARYREQIHTSVIVGDEMDPV